MAKKRNGLTKPLTTIDENQRSRNWVMLLYPDDFHHVIARDILDRGYKYVGILHDKCLDEDGKQKKAHWHFVLKFPQARWKSAIAAELGIEPNYLQVCSSLAGAYCYLVHDGLPKETQYPHSDMFGPLYTEACKALEKETDQNMRILSILDLIDSEKDGNLDERKLLQMACEAGLVGDFIRLGGLISKLIEIHNFETRDPLPM